VNRVVASLAFGLIVAGFVFGTTLPVFTSNGAGTAYAQTQKAKAKAKAKTKTKAKQAAPKAGPKGPPPRIPAAVAQRMFDGNWSVVIVTERGTCDRAYRYGISIRSGYVYYGGGGVNFTGHVAANGTVNVRVTSGGAFADGSGRLSRNVGQGFWSGQSGGSGCSGYWMAERRG
jgi:hypothetical protein